MSRCIRLPSLMYLQQCREGECDTRGQAPQAPHSLCLSIFATEIKGA
ncbi:hypothetical protein SXCC_03939 [Gluconacetobacter sp. SXCC-1]|nr:hypothetical protein SXCC_03939 [Gluconacetobacter sp. SXCC-1]